MSAVARYLKGCKMLERYEGKLSRTVLRRGEASNRLFLVYTIRDLLVLEVDTELATIT